jgi:pimeloyl-ACP methyl ester carboxylesterase
MSMVRRLLLVLRGSLSQGRNRLETIEAQSDAPETGLIPGLPKLSSIHPSPDGAATMTPIAHSPASLFTRSQGNGPMVVCLHSSTGSHAQWRALTDAIGGRCQVLSADLHGHGRSPAWPEYSVTSLQVDAQAVVRAARAAHPGGAADGVHLVGHSYGAAVALQLALSQPRWVRSLTLYEPVVFGMLQRMAPEDAALEEVQDVASTVASLVRKGALLDAAQVFTAYWSGSQAWSQMNQVQRATMATRMATVPRHFEALFAATWDAPLLAALRMPVLLMRGTQTRASAHRVSELLEMSLTQVRTLDLEGAGHMGPLSHANAVVRHAQAHLQQAGALATPMRAAA